MRLKNTKTSSQVSLDIKPEKFSIVTNPIKTTSNQAKLSLIPVFQKQKSVKGLSQIGMAELIRSYKLKDNLGSRH